MSHTDYISFKTDSKMKEKDKNLAKNDTDLDFLFSSLDISMIESKICH